MEHEDTVLELAAVTNMDADIYIDAAPEYAFATDDSLFTHLCVIPYLCSGADFGCRCHVGSRMHPSRRIRLAGHCQIVRVHVGEWSTTAEGSPPQIDEISIRRAAKGLFRGTASPAEFAARCVTNLVTPKASSC